jgi:hypothetical protein
MPRSASAASFQGVEHGDRFPVRQWDDDVGAGTNMAQDVLGSTQLLHPLPSHPSAAGRGRRRRVDVASVTVTGRGVGWSDIGAD